MLPSGVTSDQCVSCVGSYSDTVTPTWCLFNPVHCHWHAVQWSPLKSGPDGTCSAHCNWNWLLCFQSEQPLTINTIIYNYWSLQTLTTENIWKDSIFKVNVNYAAMWSGVLEPDIWQFITLHYIPSLQIQDICKIQFEYLYPGITFGFEYTELDIYMFALNNWF